MPRPFFGVTRERFCCTKVPCQLFSKVRKYGLIELLLSSEPVTCYERREHGCQDQYSEELDTDDAV